MRLFLILSRWISRPALEPEDTLFYSIHLLVFGIGDHLILVFVQRGLLLISSPSSANLVELVTWPPGAILRFCNFLTSYAFAFASFVAKSLSVEILSFRISISLSFASVVTVMWPTCFTSFVEHILVTRSHVSISRVVDWRSHLTRNGLVIQGESSSGTWNFMWQDFVI